MFWLPTVNFFFAVAGLLLLVVTIVLYIDYVWKQSSYYKQWLEQYVWSILIATSVGGIVISLVYSEYFGFLPCSLCWLQRIALYPQALFGLMAARIKEAVYFPLYSLALSLFGLAVAVYHYLYQLVPKEVVTAAGQFVPCLADGSADCGERVIDEFGFVTFPLLTAITFAFLIILYLNLRRSAITK